MSKGTKAGKYEAHMKESSELLFEGLSTEVGVGEWLGKGLSRWSVLKVRLNSLLKS